LLWETHSKRTANSPNRARTCKGRSGNTTLWYPATRIFRQSRLGDWSDVLADVAQALEQGQVTANVSPDSPVLP
jgi:hypothetical protein